MKLRLLTAVLTVAALTCSVEAADLKNCDDINSTRERTECLQSNLVLLNSSYETVARELRAAVADLKETRERFDKELATLREEVRILKERPTPDLQNVLTHGSRVQIESVGIFDKAFCLDHNTHNSNHIQGWLCHDNQVWKLNRK